MEVIGLLLGAVLFILIGSQFYPNYRYDIEVTKDEDITDTLFSDLNKEGEQEYLSNMYMSKGEKQDHLRSEYWKHLRVERLLKAGGYICEACGTETVKLDLHHVIYDHLGCEPVEDVRLLCRGSNGCHQRIHDLLGYDRATKYPIEVLQKKG